MKPLDYIGKRVSLWGKFARVMGVVETNVLALEFEDPDYRGSNCDYRGRIHVPSHRGTWVGYRDCMIVEEESALIRSVQAYVLKELNQ